MIARARQCLLTQTPRRLFSRGSFQEEFNLKLKENLKVTRWYRRFAKFSRRKGYPIRRLFAGSVLFIIALLAIPGSKILAQRQLKTLLFQL